MLIQSIGRVELAWLRRRIRLRLDQFEILRIHSRQLRGCGFDCRLPMKSDRLLRLVIVKLVEKILVTIKISHLIQYQLELIVNVDPLVSHLIGRLVRLLL